MGYKESKPKASLKTAFFEPKFIMFQKKLEERTQTVDSTELKVYGIERTINSSVDLPTTWQSYFMEDWYVY